MNKTHLKLWTIDRHTDSDATVVTPSRRRILAGELRVLRILPMPPDLGLDFFRGGGST